MAQSHRSRTTRTGNRKSGGVALNARSARKKEERKSSSPPAREASSRRRKDSSEVNQDSSSTRSSSRRTKQNKNNISSGRTSRSKQTTSTNRNERTNRTTTTRGKRSRRGSGKTGWNDTDKMLIMGGIGMGILGIILLVISYGGKEKSTTQRNVAHSNTPQAAWSPPTVTPYAHENEARTAFKRAQDLFDKGMALSGAQRNRNYQEAEHICMRILESNVSNGLKEKAMKMKYSSSKHRTL